MVMSEGGCAFRELPLDSNEEESSVFTNQPVDANKQDAEVVIERAL